MTETNKASRSEEQTLSRRSMLSWLTLACGGVAALLAGAPLVGFLLGPFLRQRPGAWIELEKVDQYPIGETIKVVFNSPEAQSWAGSVGKTAAWLRCESRTQFTAFVVNCSHLGCPVRWEPKAELFLCPCHGGVYYGNGQVAGGPPPEPLHQYKTRVKNGVLQVHSRSIPIT